MGYCSDRHDLAKRAIQREFWSKKLLELKEVSTIKVYAIRRNDDPLPEILVQSRPSKTRGRPPNDDRRTAITIEIAKYGNGWRDHLDDIFAELDRKKVDLGDFAGM